jgi:hypothetical protein
VLRSREIYHPKILLKPRRLTRPPTFNPNTPVAVVMVRKGGTYHKECFVEGVCKAGFAVTDYPNHIPRKGDLILFWNLNPNQVSFARRFAAAGAHIIITENGWIGTAPDGGKMYALCLDHHNGLGRWPLGDGERSMGVKIRPWREDGDHILVLAARGIGEPGIAQPPGWVADITKRLQRVTKRSVRLRPHPGRQEGGTPLEADLAGAWAAVTWGSGAAIKSLAMGVPVFYELNGWIGASAARYGLSDLEHPFLGDRQPMFNRLAWAQWSGAEIASGKPISRLVALANSRG